MATDDTSLSCIPIIVFLNGFSKSHNLTVLSAPPDIINRSLSEIHTDLTALSCSPMTVLLHGFSKSHKLTELSDYPDIINRSLFEMQSELTMP